MLWSLLWSCGGGYNCGPGTQDVDGVCLPLEAADTGEAIDTGEPADTGDGDPTALDLFDEVWDAFDEIYPYFVHKGIDWVALGEETRAQLDETSGDGAWNRAISDLVEPLSDDHVYLVRPSGRVIVSGTEDFEFNCDYSRMDELYLPDATTTGDLTHGWLTAGIAYARFTSWTDEDAVDAFGDALEDYAHASGIIIDVRGNGGGNELLSNAVAGRFASEQALYGYVQYRDGPEYDDFGELYERWLAPAGDWTYEGPVAVLIGPACMSSCEGFTAAMSALPTVTTVGDTTRGGSGNPTQLWLSDGTMLQLSTWIAYLSDMTVIEDRGIDPDVEVEFTDEGDAVLEAAIALLEGR